MSYIMGLTFDDCPKVAYCGWVVLDLHFVVMVVMVVMVVVIVVVIVVLVVVVVVVAIVFGLALLASYFEENRDSFPIPTYFS